MGSEVSLTGPVESALWVCTGGYSSDIFSCMVAAISGWYKSGKDFDLWATLIAVGIRKVDIVRIRFVARTMR